MQGFLESLRCENLEKSLHVLIACQEVQVQGVVCFEHMLALLVQARLLLSAVTAAVVVQADLREPVVLGGR